MSTACSEPGAIGSSKLRCDPMRIIQAVVLCPNGGEVRAIQGNGEPTPLTNCPINWLLRPLLKLREIETLAHGGQPVLASLRALRRTAGIGDHPWRRLCVWRVPAWT